jgi:[acyl-carrier-protein] S-malonyltransferase
MPTFDLKERIANTAFAFRGYNITNLGRTPELLEHPSFGPTVERWLTEASEVCAESIDRPVDLVNRVRQRQEAGLDDYAEAVSLIIAVEMAQISLLREFFQIEYKNAKVAFGFSLGEIAALVAGGVYTMQDALRVPLAVSQDAASLAEDVTLGVVFSRGEMLPLDRLRRIFIEVNSQGQGVIGMSAILSPNSVLVLGSGRTIDLLQKRLPDVLPNGIHLRRNENRWPPLHTPIMWNLNIPNRAARMLHTLPGGLAAPQPPVISLVTGKMSYDRINSREIIGQWIDHPQRLWEAVCEILSMGVDTIVHVGPSPNIVPATFERLAANVAAQNKGSRRMRALSAAVRRPWLQALLPKRASLLRATMIKQVILEDWLLEQTPVKPSAVVEART